ncbi:MAG: hypothetical protein GF383_09810 [Candidatus Lokiarchaeota archaeon]|nr:hypothetical protein [Candidatus Lokiarchaeota archaeon]MBD3340819.1 hypothetical protein [Candidatus Lokiarchaeota archaeon]
MSHIKKNIVLFDLAHNEMLNINDEEYFEFQTLLKQLNFKIEFNRNKNLVKKILNDIDILVIGNPIDNFFSNIEIKAIVDFVREGGRLLLISEYGADYLQKTNLNDISGKHFGLIFQKNIIKERNKINKNCSSILSIQDFNHHSISSQLRDIRIGGSCSLYLNKTARPVLIAKSEFVWSETYNSLLKKWSKEEENQSQIIAAYTEYGRGKVFAIGDIDIFSDNNNIGINQLDNRKFILNIFNWLMEPVGEEDVTRWILNLLGNIQGEIKEINLKINNLIETASVLEKRISFLEDTNLK